VLINFMPYILQIQYQKSLTYYGVSIAIALLSGVAGALSNTRIINYFSGDKILFVAISGAFIGAITIFFSKFLAFSSVIALIGLRFYFYSSAFIFPISSDLALTQVREDMVGFAASILTLL
jgi:hypothetical protein